MDFDVSPAWAKIQGLANGFLALLPNIILGLVLFTISCLVAVYAKKVIVGFYRRRGRHENLGLVMGRLAQALIILVNLLIALSVVLPSFNAKDLIQVLGISGVAIGFAFRDILQNFLAGILILLAEPFRVGEEIEVGNFSGVVQEIQTRATLLRTWDGFLVVIPNSCIYTEKLTVLNAYDARRTTLDIRIGLREDLGEARRLIVEAVKGVEGVLNDPGPSAVCDAVGEASVTVRARWWTDSKRADDVGVKDRVIAAVKERLLEGGIDIAYPTRQILFHDQTEETDGDRRSQRAGWPAGPGRVPRARRLADALSRLAEPGAGGNGGGPAAREEGEGGRGASSPPGSS